MKFTILLVVSICSLCLGNPMNRNLPSLDLPNQNLPSLDLPSLQHMTNEDMENIIQDYIGQTAHDAAMGFVDAIMGLGRSLVAVDRAAKDIECHETKIPGNMIATVLNGYGPCYTTILCRDACYNTNASDGFCEFQVNNCHRNVRSCWCIREDRFPTMILTTATPPIRSTTQKIISITDDVDDEDNKKGKMMLRDNNFWLDLKHLWEKSKRV